MNSNRVQLLFYPQHICYPSFPVFFLLFLDSCFHYFRGWCFYVDDHVLSYGSDLLGVVMSGLLFMLLAELPSFARDSRSIILEVLVAVYPQFNM